jgi:hypothetical protein
MLRKLERKYNQLIATPPSSPPPSIRVDTHPQASRSGYHGVYPPIRPIAISDLPPPALPSQPGSPIDDGWVKVKVLTPEQENMRRLQNEQESLIHQLQQTPSYCDAFNYQLEAIARLAKDKANVERAQCYTIRANAIFKKMLSRPGFYQAAMQYAQRVAGASFSEQDHVAYATAVQELIFLEALFLETYRPSQPRYQDLISLGKRAVAWKILNAYIDRHIADQKTPVEKISLLRLSIWYRAKKAYPFIPFTIVMPEHLFDLPQTLLSQTLNAVKNSQNNTLTLIRHLYTLPSWQYYLLKGYQYDPTIKGKTLENVCKDIEKILKEVLKTKELADTWPALDEEVEAEIAQKFIMGLSPLLEASPDLQQNDSAPQPSEENIASSPIKIITL